MRFTAYTDHIKKILQNSKPFAYIDDSIYVKGTLPIEGT